MGEQNINNAERKILGFTDEDLKERNILGGDGFEPYLNTKGGGNTIGGANAKPMKSGDNESISQGPGLTKKTVILK